MWNSRTSLAPLLVLLLASAALAVDVEAPLTQPARQGAAGKSYAPAPSRARATSPTPPVC